MTERGDFEFGGTSWEDRDDPARWDEDSSPRRKNGPREAGDSSPDLPPGTGTGRDPGKDPEEDNDEDTEP